MKYYINVFFEFDIALISVMTLSWCEPYTKLSKLLDDGVSISSDPDRFKILLSNMQTVINLSRFEDCTSEGHQDLLFKQAL